MTHIHPDWQKAIALLGVRAVYAKVVSRGAAAVLEIHDPEEAYRAIREKMAQMNITL